MQVLKTTGTLFQSVYDNWTRHETSQVGAALAFYTILSLPPLLTLIAIIAGLFDLSQVMNQLTDLIQSIIGPTGAQVVRSIIRSDQERQSAGIASVLSILVLMFGASGVFGELRSALNKIWGLEELRERERWRIVRERLVSFGLVLAMGFILIAVLTFGAAIATITIQLNGLIPIPPILIAAIDLLVSVSGIGMMFALIFRYVPARRISWKDAWIGGMVTSVLFAAGKYAIGLYLVLAAPGSAYGTAASLVVLIVWIYYTAQVIFFGAEFTHVYSSGDTGRKPVGGGA
jgi:membrane protein